MRIASDPRATSRIGTSSASRLSSRSCSSNGSVPVNIVGTMMTICPTAHTATAMSAASASRHQVYPASVRGSRSYGVCAGTS